MREEGGTATGGAEPGFGAEPGGPRLRGVIADGAHRRLLRDGVGAMLTDAQRDGECRCERSSRERAPGTG